MGRIIVDSSVNDWPPTHTIRKSKKARNITLSLTPHKGLEIILPYGVSNEEGLALLNNKRHWVEKHLPKIKTPEIEFPSEIALPAVQQIWPIRYHYLQQAKKVSYRVINDRLIFIGAMKTFEDCLPGLNQWLRKIAKEHLPNHMQRISQEIQLPFNRLSIRSQKTLWGSCNREKDISLNDRLLFLPYELMRYVMIHELCHTVYFGHGKRFWQLVARFDPNYKNNERSLRDATKTIPFFIRRC